jgi:hypothetical protein
MSSRTSTPAALSSEPRVASGRCWRLVEAQHLVSTARLTDTGAEQERLEQLIEQSKPMIPPECRHLHFLLATQFRYGAPYPRGSRFRRAGLTPGVFYASALAQTAAIEMAFHRLLFFAESPATPWPANAGQYTAFRVSYATARAIDLTRPPFAAPRRTWRHVTDYSACQNLADNARANDIDVITYESVRDPERGRNLAILACRAFAQRAPAARQSWRIHLGAGGARLICEFPRLILGFDRQAFAADPRIAGMSWAR